MARAASLLADVEPCAAHGWLTLDRAPFSDDPSQRERLALEARAIARRFGDADLEFSAMALQGAACVAAGRVAEGMTLLDETMAAVTGGEVAGVRAPRREHPGQARPAQPRRGRRARPPQRAGPVAE